MTSSQDFEDDEIGCAWCGFEGEAPERWWHAYEQPDALGERREAVTICDLCFGTEAQARGDTGLLIRSMNYVGNRILEEMRRYKP